MLLCGASVGLVVGMWNGRQPCFLLGLMKWLYRNLLSADLKVLCAKNGILMLVLGGGDLIFLYSMTCLS